MPPSSCTFRASVATRSAIDSLQWRYREGSVWKSMNSETAAITDLKTIMPSAGEVNGLYELYFRNPATHALIALLPCSILPHPHSRGRRMLMNRRLLPVLLIFITGASGQPGAEGAPPQPSLCVTPKPAIANLKPVRSCESLALITLPNTTIESAVTEPA